MKKRIKAMVTIILLAGFSCSFIASIPAFAFETNNTWDPTLGWDFQCHSHTHPNLQGLTAAEIQWEMEQVNAAFLAHGYSIPDHHAYPYGDFDEDVKAVISQYRLTGRMVWGFMMTHPVPDWFELKAAQLKRTTSWNRITGWIDDCIADQALLHIFSHEVSDTCDQYGTTPSKLTQLLDYLVDKQNAGLLTVVTMAEAYDYWVDATEGKAMVVVSFDDAYATDYTTVYPMFQDRGLKGTSYIVTSFVGEPNRLTWEMIDEMRTGTQQPPKPDLTLETSDITFTPETATEGEDIMITATIHNIGTADSINIEVEFYDGTPSIENSIGFDIISEIPVGETGTASTTWTALAGYHDIYVVADPSNLILESNENNNEASKTITVSGGGGIMHIAAIDMSWSKQGPFYRAYATVTIEDDNDVQVEGATVYGSWSGAYVGDVTGVTDADGQVTFDSGKVKKGGTFIFTITNVVKTGWTYDPTKNIETSDSIICP